jgi:hypothetical protein
MLWLLLLLLLLAVVLLLLLLVVARRLFLLLLLLLLLLWADSLLLCCMPCWQYVHSKGRYMLRSCVQLSLQLHVMGGCRLMAGLEDCCWCKGQQL